jgi:hypothetical protein
MQHPILSIRKRGEVGKYPGWIGQKNRVVLEGGRDSAVQLVPKDDGPDEHDCCLCRRATQEGEVGAEFIAVLCWKPTMRNWMDRMKLQHSVGSQGIAEKHAVED